MEITKDSPFSKSEENLVPLEEPVLVEQDNDYEYIIRPRVIPKKTKKTRGRPKNKDKLKKTTKIVTRSAKRSEAITSKDIPMPIINPEPRVPLANPNASKITLPSEQPKPTLKIESKETENKIENIIATIEIKDPVLIYDDNFKNEKFNDWEKTERSFVLRKIQDFFNNRFDIPTIIVAIHKSCGDITDAIRRLNSGEICTNPNILVHPVISGPAQNAERYYS